MIHFFSLPQLLPFPFNFFRIVLYACNHTYLPLPVQFIENNSSGLRCIPPPAASEKGKVSGDTPDPGRRTASPCTPCSTATHRLIKKPFIREGRKVIPWYHPDCHINHSIIQDEINWWT